MKKRGLGYALTMGAAAAVLLAGCGGGTSTPVNPRITSANNSLTGVNERVIYSFEGGSDGAFPMAPLIVVRGLLYGTTSEGGGSYCNGTGCGTVFQASTTGGTNKLYTFKGTPDGEFPMGRLTAKNGKWYGTTTEGGTNDDGTIFSVTKSGKEHVLNSFQGGRDGSEPFGRVISVNDKLYGTTYKGGNYSVGTVWTDAPDGTRRDIHDFYDRAGALPRDGLRSWQDDLWGVTESGGAHDFGTVFAMTTSGKEHVVYSFRSSPDGAYPDAELFELAGDLYGTTAAGGTSDAGTVFAVSPSGKERILHSFRGYPDDGSTPNSALIDLNGTLYGTTESGGRKDDGVVFSLTLSGKERVLHSFSGSPDGKYPHGGLVAWMGALYGVTSQGGTGPCHNGMGCGAIYAITP